MTSKDSLSCLRNAQQYSIISKLWQFCLQIPKNNLSYLINLEFNFFLDLKIILFYFFLTFFTAEADSVLNLFLNFEQK